MKKQRENKINHPYKAPEGYFDGFENKLRAKIQEQKPLQVTHRQSVNLRPYWLGAAAVLLLAAFAWLIYKQPQSENHKVIAVKFEAQKKLTDSLALTALQEKHPQNEEKLMEHIAEEIQQKPATMPEIQNTGEKQIAEELEEAGIIAAEINDNLLDEIEIEQ